LPSQKWRWVVAAVVVIATLCAAFSAIWPVEYDSAGVVTAHPFNSASPSSVTDTWTTIAHPAYFSFQMLWIVAVVVRWLSAGPSVRRQLTWLISAAAVSVVALVIGLVAADTPRPGLLAATLVPVAAGWAIVHGQHTAAYSALTWLSRTAPDSTDLCTELARAIADALAAPSATLWMGTDELHAVGVWPETDEDIASTTRDELDRSDSRHTRVITSRGKGIGAISVDRLRMNTLSLAENRLFDDLAAQASLVLEHVGLADVAGRQRQAGDLGKLTPRERQVLELMARGRSNAAIRDELHLSIKTVEPVVSTIFTKLALPADTASNRRVLAVLLYLGT
jgi:DNA-binding CsgD family transcriptional regulator